MSICSAHKKVHRYTHTHTCAPTRLSGTHDKAKEMKRESSAVFRAWRMDGTRNGIGRHQLCAVHDVFKALSHTAESKIGVMYEVKRLENSK